MANVEKIYTGLCVLFSVLIVLGNLIYQKFVVLPVPFVHNFELSVGVILYPLTFLITDLITELYGKQRASFCVRMAIIMNITVACILSVMDQLPTTHWSTIDDKLFHQVFGFYNIAFIGSMLACYISQALDIVLYSWIRNLTKGKHLWLRNNGSTAISLLMDTGVVIGFMTLFGVFPKNQMWTLILNSYSWKLFFTVCSTPLFYVLVKLIKWLLSSSYYTKEPNLQWQ